MKTLPVIASVLAPAFALALAACSQGPVEPTGVYRLAAADKTMVLDVRASGDYVLQIDGPGRNTDEIRGRWDNEDRTRVGIVFHGVRWQGNEPEADTALWPVQFDPDGALCIDGARLLCFAKDGEA